MNISKRQWNLSRMFLTQKPNEFSLLLEEDIEEIYEAFSHFKTGTADIIATKHFPKFLRLMGQNATEAEMIQMLREVDALDSETITYDQIMRVMRAHFETPYTEEQLRMAFDVFDRDGGGSLAAPEILYVLHKLGEIHSENEVNEVFMETDTDHDTKITALDFINIMARGIDGRPKMSMPNKFKLL
ncbi:hypothetical protein WA026_005962 [Henosepilachna vigintioctopunctata]|uniref:EF-hand domain-containing protein n=1 Tax=Henosepilachna vigintioctopunctata TaxID=420089 RepID=A0AAW1TY14_9CUCU